MAKICIDPGHGGGDPGAVNGKYHEANATLGISQKLATKLRAMGHTVVVTRNDNIAVALPKRCDIANTNNVDIFVSIHCNSAANKDASGIETFKYPKVGGITKRLADNIQNALAGHFPEEKNRGVKEAEYYVLENTKMPAVLVEVGFISHLPTAQKLFSFSYQNKMADVICLGILKTIEG